MSSVEYTSWSMPPSNVGSAQAVRELQEAFGRNGWNKPYQIAALLDALISYTDDLAALWKKQEPAVAWLSDPSGQWARIDKELYQARDIFRYWRNEVGRITQIDNEEAVAGPIVDPLLYGNWSYYEQTGQPYPPGTSSSTLAVAGMPWRAGIQMDTVIQHNAEVAERFITEDLPASVEEAIGTIGGGVSSAAGAIANAGANQAGGLFKALWENTPTPMKLGGFLLLYLWMANSGLVPSPKKLIKGGD